MEFWAFSRLWIDALSKKTWTEIKTSSRAVQFFERLPENTDPLFSLLDLV